MSEGCLRGTTQLKRNGESHCPSTNNAWECSNDVSHSDSAPKMLVEDHNYALTQVGVCFFSARNCCSDAVDSRCSLHPLNIDILLLAGTYLD